MNIFPQPEFGGAKNVFHGGKEAYSSLYTSASAVSLNSKVFARITGTVLIALGEKRFPISDHSSKVNVGLQLKFPKSNEELHGYTKHARNTWLYSQQAIDLVNSYCENFPRLFELMTVTDASDFIFESQLTDTNNGMSPPCVLANITNWLKDQPHSKAARKDCGTDIISQSAVESILAAVDEMKVISWMTK